jgi:hypothetical protein
LGVGHIAGPSRCALAPGVDVPEPASWLSALLSKVLQAASRETSPAAHVNDKILRICYS